jgi:hypothetical protein
VENNQMKLYTFYTDSHSVLLNNYFLPSIPKNDDLEVIIEKMPQECKTGNFMDGGWNVTMKRKIDYILRSIDECYGDVFIHADCDIEFYKPITKDLLEQLGEYDLAGMNDGPDCICCGFFVCRANDRTKNLFQKIRTTIDNYSNDQFALNHLKHGTISFKFLSRLYYNVSFSIGKVWEPTIKIPNIDKNIFMTHANFTIGVDNKCKLLDEIKKVIVCP